MQLKLKIYYFQSGRRMEIHNNPQHPQYNPKYHNLQWPASWQSSLRLHGGRRKHLNSGRLCSFRQLYSTTVRTTQLVRYVLQDDTEKLRRYGEYV